MLNAALLIDRNVEPYLVAVALTASFFTPSVVPRTVQVTVRWSFVLPFVPSVPREYVCWPATSSTPAGRESVTVALSAGSSGEGFATAAVTDTSVFGATVSLWLRSSATVGCGVVSGVRGRVAAIANGSPAGPSTSPAL